MRVRVPEEIGGYRLLGPLGSGGMGTVYRAVDGDGRTVALKLLHPHLGSDPDARERLSREVANLRRVRHPGIARVLDAEIDSSEAFLVTELVDGTDLATHLAEHGPLLGAELTDVAERLREALEAVHQAGVLHRDLSPGNVMMTADGPVLIDFGIAQAVEDPRVTSTGLVTGTPGYLAPELLEGGQPSVAGDWWGWAALLTFAATGRPPFGAGTVAAVLARARSGLVDLEGVGRRTAAVLRSALAVDPWRRATPTAVVEELARAAEGGDLDEGDSEAVTTVVGNDGHTRVLAGDAARPPAPDDDYLAQGGAGGRLREVPVAPGDQNFAQPVLGGEEGWQPSIAEPRRRAGSVAGLAAPLVAIAAVRPGLALAVGLGVAVLVRSVGLTTEAVLLRRQRRGVRHGDVLRGVVSWPWYLLRGAVGVAPAAILTGTVVVAVGGLLWWMAGADHLVLAAPAGDPPGVLPGNAAWVGQAAVSAVVALGLFALWFGPLSRTTRLGARWVLDATAPGMAGGAALALLGLGVAAVLGALVAGDAVVWWPFTGPPSFG
jgi:hypothetical protein